MEFNEKLQELRKQRGLTQEELAEILYVSRTAISKWESGRGFPSIESLKALSDYFSISLDELLSSEEILTIAEKDNKDKETMLLDLLYGLLDCSLMLLFFLPLFAQNVNGTIQEVSLYNLSGIQPYLKLCYISFVLIMMVIGVLTLAFQNCRARIWLQGKDKLSLVLSCMGVLLFIVGRQLYPSALLFVFLIVKVSMRIKFR